MLLFKFLSKIATIIPGNPPPEPKSVVVLYLNQQNQLFVLNL